MPDVVAPDSSRITESSSLFTKADAAWRDARSGVLANQGTASIPVTDPPPRPAPSGRLGEEMRRAIGELPERPDNALFDAHRELQNRLGDWDRRRIDLLDRPQEFRATASALATDIVKHVESITTGSPGRDAADYAHAVMPTVFALAADLAAVENNKPPLVKAVWTLEAIGAGAQPEDIAAAPPPSALGKWALEPVAGKTLDPALKKAVLALRDAIVDLSGSGSKATRVDELVRGINEVLGQLDSLDRATAATMQTRLTVLARRLGDQSRKAFLS